MDGSLSHYLSLWNKQLDLPSLFFSRQPKLTETSLSAVTFEDCLNQPWLTFCFFFTFSLSETFFRFKIVSYDTYIKVIPL
jgi:hypothetical protein